MSFWVVFFVAPLALVKGQPSLQICKTINGTDVPVRYNLREVAGSNFTLTCKLVGTDYDTADYFDDKISWGWNRKNVQFSSIADLKQLADKVSNPLKQFINKNSGINNEATIPFQPLLSVDSGKYFCMSLKYKLFNITKIRVINKLNHELVNKIEFDTWEEIGPKVFNKSSLSCKPNMFMCNSRQMCINDAYVCDNIKDCNDGSDESNYLCGIDTCKDKTSCSNGRCLSESLCCDYKTNFTCKSFLSQPPCCSEIIKQADSYLYGYTKKYDEQADNYLDEYLKKYDAPEVNFPSFQIITEPNFDISKYKFLQDDLQFKSPQFNLPKFDIKYEDINKDSKWRTTIYHDNQRNRAYMWIIIIPVMIISIILRICLRSQIDKCRNGSRTQVLLWRISTFTIIVPNNDGNSTSPNNSATEPSRTNTDDLPPSYDEVVVDVPQTTALLT